MPKRIDPDWDHHNDGSNRCGFCYEEWPCTGHLTNERWTGIQKWRQDVQDAEYQERRKEETKREDAINETFERLGIKNEWGEILKWPSYSSTMSLKMRDLEKILEKLNVHSE